MCHLTGGCQADTNVTLRPVGLSAAGRRFAVKHGGTGGGHSLTLVLILLVINFGACEVITEAVGIE